MNEIIICTIPEGDWEALYVNGILEKEWHHIRIQDVAKYCPIESIKEVYMRNFRDEDWFPEQFCDIDEGWF